MTRSAPRFARLAAVLAAGFSAMPIVARSPDLLAYPGSDGTSGAAVGQSAPASPRFRSGVDLVALDVCVKGGDGRLIEGLSADDFLIVENNTPQRVTFFSPDERVPLAVALLIDQSQSMYGEKLDRAKLAAVAFIGTLRPADLVEVIAFSARASRLFPLASPENAAEQAIAGLRATGTTGLFEATLVALRDLERAQRDRPTEYRNAIVILSDGEDTSSLVAFEDVLEDVRRSGVLVYGLSLRTDERGRSLGPLREISQFAFDSGGQTVAVQNLGSLVPTFQEIGTDLRHLYRLGYVPSPLVRDGRWHSISVRVPGKDVRVRTRSGYYAPRSPMGGDR